MANTNRPSFLTLEEILDFWRTSLTERRGLGDEKTASRIVGSGLFSEIFDKYYERDNDFRQFYDLAAALEWSNSVNLTKDWQEMEQLLTKLEGRYSSNRT